MRKRAKMRLAVLGGMIAGAVAGCWLLDMLEAAANWMHDHWHCRRGHCHCLWRLGHRAGSACDLYGH